MTLSVAPDAAQAAPTTTSATARLDRLNQQADQLVEQYLQSNLALERTRSNLAAVQRDTQSAQRSYDDLRSRIAAQAASACAVNCWNQGEIYSFHSGVAMVAMGDGSVRGLKSTISLRTLLLLATRADTQGVPDID